MTSGESNMWQLDPADGKGRPFYIHKEKILIGRAETNDIVIKNSATSSVHACITLTATEVQLSDMGSTNGTFVNGEKVETAVLDPEDVIKFGEAEFVLRPRMASGTTKLNLNELGNSTSKIDLTSIGLKQDAPKQEEIKKDVRPQNFAGRKGKIQIPEAPPPVTTGVSKDLRELEELLNGPDVAPEARGSKGVRDKEVVTLLDIDPDMLYSEFISEDKDVVHPIFNYDIHRISVEVMVLVREIVLSIDYIDMSKNASVMAVGKGKSSTKIVLDAFESRHKQQFLKIKDGELQIVPLEGFSSLCFYLNGKIVKNSKEALSLVKGDFVQFINGQLKVFVRIVSSPPQILPPPFLGRDGSLKKYIYPLLAAGLLFAVIMYSIKLERRVDTVKTAERITKILIKRDLPKLVPTPRPVSSKPEKKEEVVQETPDAPKPLEELARDVKIVDKTPTKREAVSVEKSRKVVERKQTVVRPKPVFQKIDFKNTLTMLDKKGGNIKAKPFEFNIGGNLGLADSKSIKVDKVAMAQIEGKLDSLLTGQKALSEVTGATGISSKKGFAFPKVFKKTVVLGSMDPDEVREILDQYIPLFRHCYDQELERMNNKIKGTMQLNFEIGASGRVTKANIMLQKMDFSEEGKGCVRNVLKGIQFPKPKGGGVVEIKQPLNFESID